MRFIWQTSLMVKANETKGRELVNLVWLKEATKDVNIPIRTKGIRNWFCELISKNNAFFFQNLFPYFFKSHLPKYWVLPNKHKKYRCTSVSLIGLDCPTHLRYVSNLADPNININLENYTLNQTTGIGFLQCLELKFCGARPTHPTIYSQTHP